MQSKEKAIFKSTKLALVAITASILSLSACTDTNQANENKANVVSASQVSNQTVSQSASMVSSASSVVVKPSDVVSASAVIKASDVMSASEPTSVTASDVVSNNVLENASNVNNKSVLSNASIIDNKTVKDEVKSNGLSEGILAALKLANYELISHSSSSLEGFTKVKVVPKGNQNMVLNITMNNNGRYFFNGDGQLLDIQSGLLVKDVLTSTQLKSVEEYVGVGFDNNKTFKIIKGNGSRKLAVFTDPDCPFCKKLERTMENLTDVEITYIYFPIKQLHPDAENKVNQLWNVEPSERGKVWTEFLKTGQTPQTTGPVKYKYDYNYKEKLAQDFNITGTPTIFNINSGEVQVGAMELQDLEEFLNKGL